MDYANHCISLSCGGARLVYLSDSVWSLFSPLRLLPSPLDTIPFPCIGLSGSSHSLSGCFLSFCSCHCFLLPSPLHPLAPTLRPFLITALACLARPHSPSGRVWPLFSPLRLLPARLHPLQPTLGPLTTRSRVQGARCSPRGTHSRAARDREDDSCRGGEGRA